MNPAYEFYKNYVPTESDRAAIREYFDECKTVSMMAALEREPQGEETMAGKGQARPEKKWRIGVDENGAFIRVFE